MWTRIPATVLFPKKFRTCFILIKLKPAFRTVNTMTKAARTTPKRLSKKVVQALKTIRKQVRVKKKRHRAKKKPRLPILNARHVSKKVWATRPPSELAAARAKLMGLTRDQTFTVASASSAGKTYVVSCDAKGAWSCSCPDYVYRHATLKCHYGFYCKHIAACSDTFLK